MKNLIAIVAMILITVSIYAQSNSLKINAGIMFNPQGAILIKNPEKGFQVFAPVVLITTFTKGKTTVAPFYHMNSNSIGGLVAFDFSPKIGIYSITMKNLLVKDGYTGIGCTIPVANGNASAFIETGTPFSKWEPALYIGALIPLKFKIK